MHTILVLLAVGLTAPDGLSTPMPTVDRGEVRTGPPLVHTFEVVNSGPLPITLTSVESTCGCLKPTAATRDLAPGARIPIAMTVNTLTQPAGKADWRTTIRYRVQSATPTVVPDRELVLTLSATLIREVSVSPPSVALSTATTASQTLTVTDLRAKPLTLRPPTTSNPHLTVTPRESKTEAGVRIHTLDVTVAASYPVGQADELVVLPTDDPSCPELRIPIRVTKRKADTILATPERPMVRLTAGQVEGSVLVQVRRPDGQAVRIHKVVCEHPAVRVRWSEIAGPVATMRLVVESSKTRGTPAEASVTVHLADPAGAELVVPLSWTLPPVP